MPPNSFFPRLPDGVVSHLASMHSVVACSDTEPGALNALRLVNKQYRSAATSAATRLAWCSPSHHVAPPPILPAAGVVFAQITELSLEWLSSRTAGTMTGHLPPSRLELMRSLLQQVSADRLLRLRLHSCGIRRRTQLDALALQRFQSLTHLDLSYNQLCLEGVEPVRTALAQLSSLRSMILRSCDLHAEAVVAVLDNKPHLTHLDLTMNQRLGDSVTDAPHAVQSAFVSAFNRASALRSLNVSQCYMSARTLAPILRGHRRSLSDLVLSDNVVEADSDALDSALFVRSLALENLLSLNLHGCNLSAASWRGFAGILPQLSCMQTLDLSSTAVRYAQVAPALARATALRHLCLSDTFQTDGAASSGGSALAAALAQLQGITHLDIGDNSSVPPDTASALAESIKALPALRSLSLHKLSGMLLSAFAPALASAACATVLQRLDISDGGSYEDWCPVLPALSALTCLRVLYEGGYAHDLADTVSQMTTLRELHVSCWRAMSTPCLRSLHLVHDEFGPYEHLREALARAAPTLRILSISGWDVLNMSAQQQHSTLVALTSLTSLEELQLMHQFGNTFHHQLAVALRSMPSLRRIKVSYKHWDAAAIRLLHTSTRGKVSIRVLNGVDD